MKRKPQIIRRLVLPALALVAVLSFLAYSAVPHAKAQSTADEQSGFSQAATAGLRRRVRRSDQRG